MLGLVGVILVGDKETGLWIVVDQTLGYIFPKRGNALDLVQINFREPFGRIAEKMSRPLRFGNIHCGDEKLILQGAVFVSNDRLLENEVRPPRGKILALGLLENTSPIRCRLDMMDLPRNRVVHLGNVWTRMERFPVKIEGALIAGHRIP